MAIAPRNFRASRSDPSLREVPDNFNSKNEQTQENNNTTSEETREEKLVQQNSVERERDTPASRQQAQQEAQEQLDKGFEKPKPEGYISEEDIVQSYTLQKKGVLPGDQLVDGELKRNVSDDPEGEVLTAYDIQNSPTLQNTDAEPGDILRDGKIVKSGANAPLRNAYATFKIGKDALESFADFMDTNVAPLPRFQLSEGISPLRPSIEFQYFDEEFQGATPEERRQLFQEYKEAEIAEIEQDLDIRTDTLSGKAGTFAGEVGPLGFVPFTAGTRVGLMAAEGALFGLGDLVIERAAEEGELPSLNEAAGITALGGFGGAAGSAVTKGGKVVADRVKKGRLINKAKDEQKDFEQTVANKVAVGESPLKAAKEAQEELGLTDERLKSIVQLTERKTKIPSTQKKAKNAVQDDLANDSTAARQRSSAVDKVLGAISTRIKNISPAVAGRLRNFEAKTHYRTAEKLNEVRPFIEILKKAPKKTKEQIDLQLMNGNFDAARGLWKTFAPNNVKVLDDTIESIKKVGNELEESGYDLGRVGNYFPRLVKDLDGLRSSLGREKRGQIDDALRQAATSRKKQVSDLTLDEKTEIINKVLRGYTPNTVDGRLSFTKPRKLETISPEQLKYYESSDAALSQYMRRTVNDIEKRKFFGRATKNAEDGTIDTESSIGRLIEEERANKTITPEGEQELASMLKARFGKGETPPAKIVQFVRNLAYAGTIANPYTALINLDELARSGAIFGFKDTLKSVFGKKFEDTIELGLRDATAELTDVNKSTKWLRRTFKASGFQSLDQLGKNVQINAALRKNIAKAKTAKGRQELRKKYGSQFGDETEALIKNLQDGQVTENVKMLAFSDLADMQPIALSEMSETYLNYPNARILFMLKSFTLKQYDLMRREVVQEFKKGDKAQAVKKAATIMAYMTASGTALDVTRDLILGREVSPEQLPGRAMWALLSPYGLNEYISSRYLQRGDIKGAVTETLEPATPLIDSAFSIGLTALTEPEELDEEAVRAINDVPVVGKLVYNWFLGGAEAYNERNEED